ncbi:MAG: alpha/beta hydrolase, partial [Cardiobacterium sp.]
KEAGATLHLVPAGHLFYQADELALLCRHFADFLARLEP